jgi:hypothetical protein
MKARLKNPIEITYGFSELIPRKLSQKDKIAFHMHVVEIGKVKGGGWLKDHWQTVKPIIQRYCERTGVSFNHLMKYF